MVCTSKRLRCLEGGWIGLRLNSSEPGRRLIERFDVVQGAVKAGVLERKRR